jgi:hypothetical protein
MKKSTNRRQQSPKLGGNRELAKAMQELRRSSATTPVPSGKRYKRPAPGRKWE